MVGEVTERKQYNIKHCCESCVVVTNAAVVLWQFNCSENSGVIMIVTQVVV